MKTTTIIDIASRFLPREYDKIVAINKNIIGKFRNWVNKILNFERFSISGRIFCP